MSSLIRLSPNVSPEMLNASFWTDRAQDSDRIIMDSAEIARWNAETLKTRIRMADGTSSYIINDLDRYRGGVERSILEPAFPAFNAGHPWHTKAGPVSAAQWNCMFDSIKPESMSDLNPVRPAICVRRSFLRSVPSADFYTDDLSEWYCDCACLSGILMNEPLLVICETVKKDWFYVLTKYYAGWMPASDAAFCHNDKEFDAALALCSGPDAAGGNSGRSFVTVTADRIHLSSDYFAGCTLSEADDCCAELFMGTILKALPWDSPGLNKAFTPREPFASYAVQVPFRSVDGLIEYRTAALPASLCVEGSLPYTAKNVLLLAFQSIGRKYGWGGAFYSRDCSALSQEVYRCFGFCMPRDGSQQFCMPGRGMDLSGMDTAAKRAVFDRLFPGAVVYLPGHIMLYLGKDSGHYYVLSALGSYYSEGEPRRRTAAFSAAINDLEATFRKDGRSWMSHIAGVREMRF